MVTAVCWHPRQEGLLAFGTAEGRVGVYDVFAVRNHTPIPNSDGKGCES